MFLRIAVIVVLLVAVGCGNSSTPDHHQAHEGSSTSPPSTSAAASTTPRSIQEVVAEETPANLKDELAKCKQLSLENNRAGFTQILNEVRSALPLIEPTIRDQAPSWKKVTLNKTGAGFDAIRFETRNAVDLLWAFTAPEPRQYRWDIADSQNPRGRTFMDFTTKPYLDLPELGAAEHYTVIFQQHDGGKLAPGREYFIWFRFEDEQPMDVYLKMHFFERHLSPPEHFTKPQEAAEALGFELPFRLAANAPLAVRAKDVLETNGAPAALEFLDPEMSKTNECVDHLFYVQLAQKYAIKVATEDDNREEANRYFLKSAESMRTILATNGQLGSQNAGLPAQTFYNEACALALSGKQDDAMRSLQDAVAQGFRDVAMMRGDDDFESLQDLPEFKQLVEELEAVR